MKSETKFGRELVSKVRQQGGFVQRIETAIGAGVPDMYVCYNGMSIWIETKVGDYTLQPLQQSWHKQLRVAGGKVVTVTKVKEDMYRVEDGKLSRAVTNLTDLVKLILTF